MKSYLYTAHLEDTEGNIIKESRYFSVQLSEEQLLYLNHDLEKLFPDHKLLKYELEIR